MYIEYDEGYPTHRKTLRLCALMKSDTADAYPPRLWSWATRAVPDGDLTGMDPSEIEAAVRFRGKPGTLFEALVRAGFLDQEGDRITIHNWAKRTGAAVVKMADRAYRVRERRAHRDGRCLDRCSLCAQHVPGSDPDQSQARPNQDKTSQDQSSQDKSSQDQTSPLRSEGERPPAPPPAPGPFREPRRPAVVGAATPAFLGCFNAYPNKDAKQRAAQVWQEIAADFPGGEAALARAISARFAAGMLRRHPYAGEARFRPTFESFLADRRWEDPDSDPDTKAAPARAAAGGGFALGDL